MLKFEAGEMHLLGNCIRQHFKVCFNFIVLLIFLICFYVLTLSFSVTFCFILAIRELCMAAYLQFFDLKIVELKIWE